MRLPTTRQVILLTLTVCFLSIDGLSQTVVERLKTVPDAKKFTAKYDKFKDETTLDTHLMFRYPKGKIWAVECTIRTVTSGETITKPVANFGFTCYARFGEMGRFLQQIRMIFLLDGSERLEIGDGSRDEGVVDRDGFVFFTLSASDLQKLSSAQRIEMQLGEFAGEMEKDSQPRIKTMLDLTTPK